ncbi:O-methyltransferase [Pendulispora albinea]|uniref:Class I SAM-dependent methyltransferase n=1 Tax=Pendulispora albinea TaxID=2741071 RepID=A0ABZ2LJR4_9BACT
MNTLTTAPVSTLLTRLFAQAEAADAGIRAEYASLSPEARASALNRANSNYRAFYSQAKNMYLPVSAETGTLLYMLARTSRARSIVEFGTSFGISTVHLAAALKDNGGGRLIGSEFEPSKAAQARENLKAAGLSDLVEIREGDALESLARDLPDSIDLVLLDGAKVLYPRILALLEPRLSPGALVVADNADHNPEFLANIRAAGSGYLSVPFASDVEVSMRVAGA